MAQDCYCGVVTLSSDTIRTSKDVSDDADVACIAGGSIEILKNRIAESVFERTFSQRPPKTGKA